MQGAPNRVSAPFWMVHVYAVSGRQRIGENGCFFVNSTVFGRKFAIRRLIAHERGQGTFTLEGRGSREPSANETTQASLTEPYRQQQYRTLTGARLNPIIGATGDLSMNNRALLLTLAGSIGLSVGNAANSTPAPTFTKDIAPILYQKCTVCHRAGEIAPMPFVTYQEVRPWSAAIKQSVLQRKMPPWFADPHFGKFKNDRALSEAQITKLVAWVNAGSPKGDDKAMPPLPKFTKGWSFDREPDLVVEMPLTAQIPATGVLDLPNYYVKNPLKEEVWVEGVELRPSNPKIVHHSIVSVVTLPDSVTPEQLVAGKKLGQLGWKLVGQAPGKGAEMHWEGTAKRLVPNTYFEFNMHYTPNGSPQTDRSVIGFWFAKKPVHHEVMTRPLSEELFLGDKKISRRELPKIPAGAENWQIVTRMTMKDDITLYSLSPHMHLRGKDMKYTVTYPDGRDEVLLNVPNYQFDWQLNYEFETPKKIPAGSRFTVTAHYDNSKNNPFNPAPTEDVVWGQQSWNEMFIPWSEYTVDKLDLTKMTAEQKARLPKGVADPETVRQPE